MRTKSEVIDEIASPFLVFHFRVDGSLMWNLAQISSPCGLMVKALAFYNLSDLFMSKQGIGGSIPPRGFFFGPSGWFSASFESHQGESRSYQ